MTRLMIALVGVLLTSRAAGYAFTVLVPGSDRAARRPFAPYQADTDPDAFELLEGNVIVLADGSNGPEPLARATRTKIRRAIELLRRASS